MQFSSLFETSVSEQLPHIEKGALALEAEAMQVHRQWQVRDSLHKLPESLTAFALVNDAGEEQIITDIMISRACEQLDCTQLWPLPEPGSAVPVTVAQPVKGKILQFSAYAG